MKTINEYKVLVEITFNPYECFLGKLIENKDSSKILKFNIIKNNSILNVGYGFACDIKTFEKRYFIFADKIMDLNFIINGIKSDK